MKNITKSLAIIAAVAAIVVGGSIAYFSDTETSTGNTFTAGNLDLKIDSTCHYNGMVCDACTNEWKADGNVPYTETETEKIGSPCFCSWAAKDLDGDKFFDYGDIKPGDWGENTLSFKVFNNDAYGRVKITAIENRENGCNEPEKSGPTADETCVGRWCGELAQNMYSFVWVDNGVGDTGKGDNIYQNGEEVVTECGGDAIEGPNGLMYCQMLPDSAADTACQWSLANDPQGGLNDHEIVTIPVANGIFLEGGETNYLGVAWFIPNSVDNIIQGDSIKADVSFEIVQARHNNSSNPFETPTP